MQPSVYLDVSVQPPSVPGGERLQDKLYAAHVNYGEAFRAEGQRNEATTQFQKAIALDPGSIEAPAALYALRRPPTSEYLPYREVITFQDWIDQAKAFAILVEPASAGWLRRVNEIVEDSTPWGSAAPACAVPNRRRIEIRFMLDEPVELTPAKLVHESLHIFFPTMSECIVREYHLQFLIDAQASNDLIRRFGQDVQCNPQQVVGEGDLVKGPGPAIYLIEKGQRRHIPDPETFDRMGFNWAAIRLLTDEKLAGIPEGSALPRKRR